MKALKLGALVAALALALCACACSDQTTPAPTPGTSITPGLSPTATISPDPSKTPDQSPEMSPSASPEASPSASPGGSDEAGALSFTPGKYKGEGQGMNGAVVVETEFSQDKIVSVALVEHNETPGIYEKAADTLTLEIVEGQTLNVGAVTGATYTSNAIIKAVEDCVTQAGGDVGRLKMAQ